MKSRNKIKRKEIYISHILIFILKNNQKSTITINLLYTTLLHSSTLSCHFQVTHIPYVILPSDGSILLRNEYELTEGDTIVSKHI